jgi:hypothetical protein
MSYCSPKNPTESQFKAEILGHWIAQEWIRDRRDLLTIWSLESCVDERALMGFNRDLILDGGYRFSGYERVDSPVISNLAQTTWQQEIAENTGAFIYHFAGESGDTLEIMVTASYFNDDLCNRYPIVLTCIPRAFVAAWKAFENECSRLVHGLDPEEQKVYVIGGRLSEFAPTVDWTDIILPEQLKADVLNDVQAFFTKGVSIYQRLKLKPFRKLLLAGVPGTGKTMICSALAKWMIAQGGLVIYVSSGNQYGATFFKIDQAISIAAHSRYPTMIILEELDAYLRKKDEKALVLNVLDGQESAVNPRGTLLVATTNYPEAIDKRVLKRPGRLDRVFIIPVMKSEDDAERMLCRYLGDYWLPEHSTIAAQLVGFPGAFIREVAIQALMSVASQDMDRLPIELLEDSCHRLKAQIDARDDFLMERSRLN